MNQINVLWFSRHNLLRSQANGLNDVIVSEFGKDAELGKINQVSETIESASEIINKITDEKIVAVVLPVELLAELFENKPNDVIIIVPRSKRILNEDKSVTFEHDYWEVVENVVHKSHKI